MVKRKKNSEINNDIEEEPVAEVPPKISKKKKSKKANLEEEVAEVSEEEPHATTGDEDNSDQEVVATRAKKPRKKRTMQKKREIVDENGEGLSDIEKHYVAAVRVKVDDAGEFYRLNGRLADLETKVFDISEDEWNPNDPLNMPPQGILVDGLPFHHCYPYPLKPHHIKRLYAHGITLSTKYFSPGEDEQIIENWKIYARKNSLEYEDAPIYCGWAKHLGYQLPMSIKKFHQKTKFLPYMCRGLLDRCAIQVYRRCYRIFDPRNDEFGRYHEKEWTEEDDQRLQQLYNFEGPSWQKIAVQLRRNRFQVQTRYQRVICGEKPKQVPRHGKTKLLYIKDEDNLRGVIYEYAKDVLPAHPVILVTRGIGEIEERNINWNELCQKYSNLDVAKCQTEWSRIKAQLRAAYNRENNPAITFTAIEKIVFGTNPKKYHNLKPKIARKAFQILHELAKENEIEELWEIDAAELTRRLKEAEVVFFTSYTLGSHILRIAHRILTTLKHSCLLPMLPVETTVIELIEMLAYFMKKSRRKLKLSKVECLHYIQRFIKHKGWTPNDKFAVINKKELAQLEAIRAAEDDSDNDEQDDKDSDDEEENVESDKDTDDVAMGDEDVDEENEVSDDIMDDDGSDDNQNDADSDDS